MSTLLGEAASEAAEGMRQFAAAFTKNINKPQGPPRLPNNKRERVK